LGVRFRFVVGLQIDLFHIFFSRKILKLLKEQKNISIKFQISKLEEKKL